MREPSRQTVRVALVGAGITAIGALALSSAYAMHPSPPRYDHDKGYGCSGHRVDPTGIQFYGEEATAQRSAQRVDEHVPGMESGTNDEREFKVGGWCVDTQTSDDDGCFNCTRNHIRIAGHRYPNGDYYAHYNSNNVRLIYSDGTPHHEVGCGTLNQHHVIPKGGYEKGREVIANAMYNDAFPVSYVWLGNNDRIRYQSCNDTWARGDGFLAQIKLTR